MNNETRTKNSIRNILFGIVGQLVSVLINFLSRTIFIQYLGANYLGVNGLFGNILSMLSLAELGIGSAITYSMYRPLAEKDTTKINALMNFYTKAYRTIGLIVAVLGLSLIPWLDYIIKDKPNIPHLTIIYLLFLSNSVVTYFFAYKRSIIIADQKNHLNIINQYGFSFAQSIVQILILVLNQNYLLYLSIQLIFNFLSNITISKKADRLYPYLRNFKKEILDKESRTTIFKNIGAMASHKIGGVVVLGTDNILISAFVGVYWVGIYSNYNMIVNTINMFLKQIFLSISASVGNLNATQESVKSYRIFNTMFFMNFWLYGFCSVSLVILLNPFITMWLSSSYIMNRYIVVLIVINFFITGMRNTAITYTNTTGLFWNSRYKPLFEALINLVASVILLKKYGLIGVFLGTLISTITTSIWIEPWVIYKHKFHKPLTGYFIKFVVYSIATIVAVLLTQFACSVFTTYTLLSIIYRGLLCILIPNIFFTLLFFRTSEFKHLQGIAVRSVRSIKNNLSLSKS